MQVPASFQYRKATSVEDALALLAEYGPESAIVAGGHSLLPMMKLRLAHPEALVDINDVAELTGIRVDSRDGDGDGADELVIGAMTRHAELLACGVAGRLFPILHDAERVIADPIVRNRGTVGGSLCQADPSEDLSAVFAALRASLVVHGPGGTRTVAVRDFFVGPYQTVLEDGELLGEIRVPVRDSAGAGSSAYVKVERRAGDWAVGAAGAVLTVTGNGAADEVVEVGIGLTALGAARFVAAEAEDHLRGGPPTEARLVEAGRIAAAHCRPTADQRGPVDYKRHLAGELTTRALRGAVARCR